MIRAVPWLLLAGLPLMVDNWQLLQLSQYLTYGLFAMSLGLIWGQVGLLCFGHALFFGMGAYTMSVVTLGLVPGLQAVTSSWLGIILAFLVPAAFALLLGQWLFRGRAVRGAYFGVITLALAVIAERSTTSWNFLGGLNGLIGIPPFDLLPFAPTLELFDGISVYYWTLAVCTLSYAALVALLNTRRGLILRAIREADERVEYLGIDTALHKAQAFAIGAGIAGLAGGMFVTQFGFASPTLIGFGLSAEVLVWVALGGRGLLVTSFLGAVLVRYLESWLADWLGAFWLLGLGAAFIVVVIFLPRGLLAEPYLRLKEWRNARVDGVAKNA